MQDRILKAGEQSHVVRFGQNAVFLLEQRLEELEIESIRRVNRPRRTLRDISFGLTEEDRAKVAPVPLAGLELLKSMPTAQAMHMMLWAGLDGGRLREKKRVEPFRFEEVGDLIDEAGGIEAIMPVVMQAYSDAFPERLPKDWEKLIAKVNTPEAPQETKNGRKGSVSDLPSAGKPLSSKRSKPESPSSNIGT